MHSRAARRAQTPAGNGLRFRDIGVRVGLVVIAPAVAYGAIRPLVGSDAAALAAAGAIPVTYNIVLAVWRRRVDRLGVVSAISLALGCVLTVVLGGSALPLKLKLAAITFLVGLVLLLAVLARKPIPLARVFRKTPDSLSDSMLGALIGGFLILHAMLHLALAVLLPTQSYVIASPIIDWGTLGLGFLALRAYIRHLSAEVTQSPGGDMHISST